MKKIYYISLVLLMVFVGCKNIFMDEYDELNTSNSNNIVEQKYDDKLEGDPDVLDSNEYPWNVQATDGVFKDKIKVSWERVKDIPDVTVSYSIYRKVSGDASAVWSKIAENIDTDFYEDAGSGLKENVVYDYAVKAVYSRGNNSIDASRYSFIDTGILFSNPEMVTATLREYNERIKVTWSSVVGAAFYVVERRVKDSGDEFLKVSQEMKRNYFNDFSKEYGGSLDIVDSEGDFVVYEYRVVVYRHNNYTCNLDNAPILEGQLLALGAPAKVVVTGVSNAVYSDRNRIEWKKNSNAKYYTVYRSKNINGPWKVIDGADQVDKQYTYYEDKLSGMEEAEKREYYYYKVSATNDIAAGSLSNLDEDKHKGRIFYIDFDFLANSYVAPENMYIFFDNPRFIDGNEYRVQYADVTGGFTNFESVVGWTDVGDAIPTEDEKHKVIPTGYNFNNKYAYRVLSTKTDLLDNPTVSPFNDLDNTKGKSNILYVLSEQKPLDIPKLYPSRGDFSVGEGKVKVTGNFVDPDIKDYIKSIKLKRLYRFGDDDPEEVNGEKIWPYYNFSERGQDFIPIKALEGEPIVEHQKEFDISVEDDGSVSFIDNVGDDIYWSYWIWDREMWKYLNRGIPFDMRKAVGVGYKVVIEWQNLPSGIDPQWIITESEDWRYGYQALSDDEFGALSLIMFSSIFNRVYHLLYLPFVGEGASDLTNVLLAAQSKNGAYGGVVSYSVDLDIIHLTGNGSMVLNNYSDFGPEWSLSLANSPAITVQNNTANFSEFQLVVKTPLYEGNTSVGLTIVTGSVPDYLDFMQLNDNEKGSGFVEDGNINDYVKVTQNGRPEVNLGRDAFYKTFAVYKYREFDDDSINLDDWNYYGENDAKSNRSHQQSAINFKYPIHSWPDAENRVNNGYVGVDVDWTMDYGFAGDQDKFDALMQFDD